MNDTDPTGAYEPGGPAPPSRSDFSFAQPEFIGRYRIERLLGQGGFGLVFLAFDDQLQRHVAIKVPHAKHITRPEDAAQYLAEARTVAALDHSNIVPVYDAGSTQEFACYIVAKYIEGNTLAHQLKTQSYSPADAARLVAVIADALHFAHTQSLVHRDVKPGNILIDVTGKPFLVDFGLALREENLGTGPRFAGTNAYMSPEQARGEGHRVDGRSDVFSLGIVFYEMLTGRRPFKAETKQEWREQISEHDPRPPRQYDDHIPKELERICLKAMAKRAMDRYSTAKDFADELRHYLADSSTSQVETRVGGAAAQATRIGPSPAPSTAGGSVVSHASVSSGPPLRIVPKGPRSFDSRDADFFLELLPGPRDRDDLPDSIRFWKTRLEETNADATFPVGLIYGPSGCGKSSLVKAGLLPRLAPNVIAVYLEATGADTETRLFHALRKQCPGVVAYKNLIDTMVALRRGRGLSVGRKVVIVIDQFEQWLHARRDETNTELVQALRHCDGEHVQCVVMVRDDFWMGATRFFRELEINLVERENSAVVDLFPMRHAEKVLAAFGRAFGILPDSTKEMTREQTQFVHEAVKSLAQEGKVICVRLALFAEMMKARTWTPASLKEVGGARGVGETFLEETFSARTAPPPHRLHEKAARAVLKALLPEPGADIKGHMRSYGELLEASGYSRRPDFDDLIRILDGELRLITPTDPAELQIADCRLQIENQPATASYFQLTHDYLVPPLRDWLTRKQKESRRGRAELMLADQALLWNSRPENRLLPTLVQWTAFHLLTSKRKWTDPQRHMMKQANRYYALRGVAFFVVLAFIGFGLYEGTGRLRAQGLRDRLLEAKTSEAPDIIAEMGPVRRWVDPLLQSAFAEAAEKGDARKQLHASLALLTSDAGQLDYLHQRLLRGDPQEVAVIRAALYEHRDHLGARLWTLVETPTHDQDERFRAACALAHHDPSNVRWEKAANDVAAALVTHNPLVLSQWIELLQPAGQHLAPALAAFLEDERRSVHERGLIAKSLGAFSQSAVGVIDRLEKQVQNQCDSTASREAKNVFCKKQASRAAALLVIGRCDKIWPHLAHQSDPTLRSFLADRVAPAGVDAKHLIARLEQPVEVSVLRMILLCLGDFGPGQLSLAERRRLLPKLTSLFRDHPDPGVHGAADWLLRRWQADDLLERVQKELATGKLEGSRQWLVNKQGLTFNVVTGPGLLWIGEGEEKRQLRLERRYAIAAKEVTAEQFRQFRPSQSRNEKIAPTLECPMNGVSWYDAAAYCNWLSAEDGLHAEEWCYVPNANGKYAEGMSLAPNYWTRRGYRLPTEAEWVHACRAGAETDFYFGHAFDLMGAYAWHAGNSGGHSHPVGTKKPNDLGLFDMHGNAWEWTNDIYRKPAPGLSDKIIDDVERTLKVDGTAPRVQIGGSWGNQTPDLRPSFRIWNLPSKNTATYGIRPVRVLPADR